MKSVSQISRSVAMPLCMVAGALMCRQIAWLDNITQGLLTPLFIFIMLFFTYCSVDARKIRFSWMHLWLILFQITGSIAIYYALVWCNEAVAQGAMICILSPVAMAAVVIGGMLGACVETMVAYSLLCNLTIACVAPMLLHDFGNGECSMLQIIERVVPLLVAPFLAGQLCRLLSPKAAKWVTQHSQLSFYVWLMSLLVIIGRTTCFLIDYKTDIGVEVVLAVVALIICLLQFAVGRIVGRRYGDTVAGGQSLGQKNTVLAVWLSQSFLDPIACVAPTAYIVWQNLVNSYQLYRAGQQKQK